MTFFDTYIPIRVRKIEIQKIDVVLQQNPSVADRSEWIRGAILQRLHKELPPGDTIALER